MAQCTPTGATLLVAKLGRLSRDAHFLLGLQKAGVDFVATDMPFTNWFTVGIMALVAKEEREMVSRHTKEALAATRVRGTILGGYRAGVVPYAKDGSCAMQVRSGRVHGADGVDCLRAVGHGYDETARALSA